MKRKVTKRSARQAAAPRRNVGDRIVASLTDLRDSLRAGEPLSKRFTVRTVEIPAPQEFQPGRIRALRDRLGMSQSVFASLIGVSRVLVQSWEQGTREPSLLARRLLAEVDRDPRRWQKMIVPESDELARTRRSA
jgi:putative transcriptional regulator